MYSLVETFDSIQGEGLYNGSLCFFLRLGGCDIGCGWCDEKKVGMSLNIQNHL